jgi:hypothetical protein
MLTLVAGVGLALACGGDDDDGGDDGDAPTAEATTDDSDGEAPTDEGEDEPTADDSEDNEDNGGGSSSSGSIDDIAVPEGAEETFSGEFSGGPVPIPAGDLDSSAYGTLQYATYTLDGQSAEDVLDFYKDEFSDWEEVATFSGGAGGSFGAYGAWTQDDDNVVVWIGVSDNGQGGSELAIYRGQRD